MLHAIKLITYIRTTTQKLKKQVHEMSDEELDKVAGGLISFNPLLRYLKAHEISMYQMIKDGVITPTEST